MEGEVKSIASLFLKIDRVTTLAAGIAASLALAVAVFAGFWQVTSRFVFQAPATWSEALVRMALIWMVMLGLSVALRQGALVSIDIAHRYSKGAFRVFIETAVLISNLIMLGTLFWFGIKMAERVKFQEMAGLDISIAWGYAAIPIGCMFALIGAVAHYFDHRNEELESAV
jgi:TRAP-type C4-dicarboxylate transport system permease small subunit